MRRSTRSQGCQIRSVTASLGDRRSDEPKHDAGGDDRDSKTDESEAEPCEVGHWMTWSALSSSDGGIGRPSAFAVLALIISSNVVACWIARSPGFAPFRILST